MVFMTPDRGLRCDQTHYQQLFRAALLGAARDRSYAVPSAGALYPYDIELALLPNRGSEKRYCLTLPELAAGIFTICAQDIHKLTVTLWFRPSASIRKYGERGITYGMQDCGHLIANLAMASRHLGLTFASTDLPFAAAFEGSQPLPARIGVAHLEIGPGDEVGSSEDGDHHGARLLAAMMMRRSASAFAGPADAPGALGRVLNTAQAMQNGSNAADEEFGFHLAQRDGAGGWRLSAAPAMADLFSAATKQATLDLVSLFCLQRFTASAGAMLVISAPLGSRHEILRQSLALGQLGQYLYVAAEMHRCAACCVGGFDYDAARRSVALPHGRYAAYAMLFGLRGSSRKKVDRASIPTPRPAVIPLLLPELNDAQS